MATATRIYTANTAAGDYYPGNPGWYASRRAYSYANYFGSYVHKNQNRDFTLMATGGVFSLKTEGPDNGSDRKIINFHHIMKTSSNSSQSYGRMYWNTQKLYWNTVGLGPFFGTNGDTKAFWHPNVIGATFTWRKDTSHYDAGEVGFDNWGLVYYSPSRNQWRTVRFHKGRKSGNHWYSAENDDWTFHGGDPTAYGTEVNGWQGNGGYLGTTNRNYVMTQDWLWGGLYFTGGTTTRGSASHTRNLDISDFQPIYGDKGSGTKLILPFGSQEQSDLRNSGRRKIF